MNPEVQQSGGGIYLLCDAKHALNASGLIENSGSARSSNARESSVACVRDEYRKTVLQQFQGWIISEELAQGCLHRLRHKFAASHPARHGCRAGG